MEEWMFISWSDNCSLIFRVNTTMRFYEGLSSHQLGKILLSKKKLGKIVVYCTKKIGENHVALYKGKRINSNSKFDRRYLNKNLAWKIAGSGRLRRIHWLFSISRAEPRPSENPLSWRITASKQQDPSRKANENASEKQSITYIT